MNEPNANTLIAKNRKISVYVKEKKTGNVTWTCINTVRMTFLEEPAGTKMYISKTEKGFTISRFPSENAVEREVCLIKNNSGMYKPQYYLNFRGIVNQNGSYDLYSDHKGTYTLVESANQPDLLEKKSRPVGCWKPDIKEKDLRITHMNAVRISQDWVNRQTGGNSIKDFCFIVEEHFRPYCYVKLRIARKTEGEQVPEISQTYGSVLKQYTGQEYFQRRVSVSEYLTITRYMRNFGSVSTGSLMHWQEKEDGSVILTIKEHYCDVCGKVIKGDASRCYNMDICSSCGDAVRILKKHTQNGKNGLSEIKKQLLNVSAALTEIYNEIMEEK